MNVKSIASACCPPFLKPALDRIVNSPIGFRLARGVFWSMAGAVISRAMMLVATALVARMLGKTVYGELGMIQSTVGMFGVFAGFGLGLTATKHVAEFCHSDPDRAGRIIGLSGLFAMVTGGFMAIGLFVFASWLAEHTINAPHLAGVLRIGALILFISALNGAQTGALSGFEAFKTIAYVNFFVGLISFPILVAGAYFGGLTGAVWGLAINLVFNWLLNHIALRKEARRYSVPFTFKQCSCEWPVLWKFSLPAVLNGAIVSPVTWAGNAILVNQPNGYSAMGAYNAVYQIKIVPELILGMLVAPLLPMLSEYFGKGDTKSYSRMLTYAFTLSMGIIVPVSLLQVAAPWLTLLPFGKEYGENHALVQWMMLHACMVGLFSSTGTILASLNRMWIGLGINAIWAVSYLVLAYFLAPAYGASGLAAALALSGLASSVYFIIIISFIYRSLLTGVPVFQYALILFCLYPICLFIYRCCSFIMAGVVGISCALLCIVLLYYISNPNRKKFRLTKRFLPQGHGKPQ